MGNLFDTSVFNCSGLASQMGPPEGANFLKSKDLPADVQRAGFHSLSHAIEKASAPTQDVFHYRETKLGSPVHHRFFTERVKEFFSTRHLNQQAEREARPKGRSEACTINLGEIGAVIDPLSGAQAHIFWGSCTVAASGETAYLASKLWDLPQKRVEGLPIHTLPSHGGVQSTLPAFAGTFRQPPCEHLYQGNAGAFFRFTPDSFDFQAEISWSATALVCSMNGLRYLGEWLVAKRSLKRVMDGGVGDIDLPYGSALLSKAYEVVAEVGRWSIEPFAVGGLWSLTTERKVASSLYSIVLGFVAVELPDSESSSSHEVLTHPKRLAPMLATLSISRDRLGFVAIVPQKITRLEPHHLEIYAESQNIATE